jgi:hypothetical protein
MSARDIVEQRLLESSKEIPPTIYDAGFNSIVDAASKNFLNDGWDVTLQKVALIEKVATLQDEDFVAGQQAAIELLSTLSENEFLGLIQGDTQMSYEFGKEAAYGDFVEMSENGAGFSDVMDAVQNTLAQELEKYASEDDVDARLGIESVCYQFLKVANDIFGQYDVTDSTDEEVLDAILMKIAVDERSKEGIAQGLRDRYGAHGRVGIQGIGDRKRAKDAREASTYGGGGSYSTLDHTKGSGPGLGERMKSRLGEYVDKARYTAKNLSRNEKIGVGAGAAALGLGAAGGAYALNQRRKAKQEQEKSASDYRVEEALEILAEAGLLDD